MWLSGAPVTVAAWVAGVVCVPEKGDRAREPERPSWGPERPAGPDPSLLPKEHDVLNPQTHWGLFPHNPRKWGHVGPILQKGKLRQGQGGNLPVLQDLIQGRRAPASCPRARKATAGAQTLLGSGPFPSPRPSGRRHLGSLRNGPGPSPGWVRGPLPSNARPSASSPCWA